MQQVKLFDLGRRISVVDNEHFTVENNEKHKKLLMIPMKTLPKLSCVEWL